MPSTVAVGTGSDDVQYLGPRSYDSVGDRKTLQQLAGAGVETASDFKASYSGSGMNLQVTAGAAFVRGTNVEQGLYRVRQSTNVTTLTVSNNGSSNNRIDRVVLRIYDNDSEAAGSFAAQVEVLAGSTTTGGATLDNLLGAVDLSTIAAPKTLLLLADVLVPAGASSILNSNIRDRRRFATPTTPQLDYITYDAVPLTFHPGAGRITNREYDGSVYASHQSAALVWCARRVVGVTKVRWRYATTAAIPAGTNWAMALCDASGRFIANTGSVLLDGTNGDDTAVAQAWSAAFNIDIGWHYLAFGVGAFASGGKIRFNGLDFDASTNPADGPIHQNLAFKSGSAGVTFGSGADANTIRYLTDAYNLGVAANIGIPQVSISVG